MRQIPISVAKSSLPVYALVDDQDYEAISLVEWNLCGGYAAHYHGRSGRDYRGVWKMHRVILEPPDHMLVDHINGNRLDNRRCNLRMCTYAQNRMNSAKNRNNRSGYKGVTWCKATNNWRSYTCYRDSEGRKRTTYFGYFPTAEEAYAAYCAGIASVQGQFVHSSIRQ